MMYRSVTTIAGCTAGLVVQCEVGFFNPTNNANNQTACEPCPRFSTTERAAAHAVSLCRCIAGYYDSSLSSPPHRPVCAPCPVGTNCLEMGVTLATLPIRPGYFRPSVTSPNAVRCGDASSGCGSKTECFASTSGCSGGSDPSHACRPSLSGMLCEVCLSNTTGRRLFYTAATDEQAAGCEECGKSAWLPVLAALAVVGGLAGLLLLCRRLVRRYFSEETLLTHAHAKWSLFSLGIKLKIVLGFYMIAAKLSSVYDVELPPDVQALLSFFDKIISIGMPFLDAPLDCLGAGGFASRLAFFFFAPLCVLALLFAFRLGHTCVFDGSLPYKLKKSSVPAFSKADTRRFSADQSAGKVRAPLLILLERALVATTPSATTFLFVAYPLATTVAFQSFSCYDFGESGRWLMADVAIQCDTEEHRAVVWFAWVAVAIHPVGLLLVTAALLGYHAGEIKGARPHTKLSRSLSFLYHSYSPDYYYWDLVEMGRRFLLVGVAVIVQPGSIVQLALATLLSLLFVIVQHQCTPYANPSDGFLALAASFALTVLFFSCILLKLGVLVSLGEVRAILPNKLLAVFDIPSDSLVVVIFTSVVFTLAFTALTVSLQLKNERDRVLKASLEQKARRLRYEVDDSEVQPHPIDDGYFHIFLSHVWITGQDQMRIVKQRLLEMMPDLLVFLDVDDLEDISDLEGYVDRSYHILIFCSKGKIRYDTTRHDTIRHDTTRHDTTRHDTIRRDTTRHNTKQYNTIQYNTIRYNQYNTI